MKFLLSYFPLILLMLGGLRGNQTWATAVMIKRFTTLHIILSDIKLMKGVAVVHIYGIWLGIGGSLVQILSPYGTSGQPLYPDCHKNIKKDCQPGNKDLHDIVLLDTTPKKGIVSVSRI